MQPPRTEVYIPTRGRIGLSTQVTLREFLELSTIRPWLVCPPDEVKQHRAYYPRVLACGKEGIGPTRQWILENSRAEIVVMADDDMYFFYRPDIRSVKLERVPPGGLDTMLDILWYLHEVEGYCHGGVGARQGNNTKDLTMPRKGQVWTPPLDPATHSREEVILPNDRVNNFHFMHRETVLKVGARLDALPVMEDFHFTLTMLTKGYPNVVLHSYVWNQRGSGAVGGCSTYRTAAVQAAGAEGLHAAFPQFVRVTEKESKETSTAWKDFKVRKDVVVQWERAYKSSQTNKVNPGSGLFA